MDDKQFDGEIRIYKGKVPLNPEDLSKGELIYYENLKEMRRPNGKVNTNPGDQA